MTPAPKCIEQSGTTKDSATIYVEDPKKLSKTEHREQVDGDQPVRTKLRRWIMKQKLTPKASPWTWLIIDVTCFSFSVATFVAVLIAREDSKEADDWTKALVTVFLLEAFISTAVWCIQVIFTILDEYDVEEYLNDPELLVDDSERKEANFRKIPCDTKVEALLAIVFTIVTIKNFFTPRESIDSLFGLIEIAANGLAFAYEAFTCWTFIKDEEGKMAPKGDMVSEPDE